MKTKLLAILICIGSGLFAQSINGLTSLDSIKKTTSFKHELVGFWELDTINSNLVSKRSKGDETTILKTLHYKHNVTQWDFLPNKTVVSAPYKETLYLSMNPAKDKILLFEDMHDDKAKLMVVFTIQELTAKKMTLVSSESGEIATIVLIKKERGSQKLRR